MTDMTDYNRQNLSNMIEYNDEGGGNLSSKIECNLNANITYYIKFRGYNNSVSARLTVVSADADGDGLEDKSVCRYL